MERARFDRCAQGFQQFCTDRWRGGRHQQNELFAAETCDEIGTAQAFAQHRGYDLQDFVTSQMAVVVVDSLEVIKVEHCQAQRVAVLLPLLDFMLETFAPGRAVGQAGERIDKGLLALLFKVLAEALGFLLHVRHALGETFEARRDFLFPGIALLLVLIHGAEQAFEMIFQHLLEVIQVGSLLDTGLQAVDLLPDLRVHRPRR